MVVDYHCGHKQGNKVVDLSENCNASHRLEIRAHANISPTNIIIFARVKFMVKQAKISTPWQH